MCIAVLVLFEHKSSSFTSDGVRKNFRSEKENLIDKPRADVEKLAAEGTLTKEEREKALKEIDEQERTSYVGWIEKVVHPHSMIIPVMFFILVHLTEMTRLNGVFRLVLYSISFLGVVGVIFAPLYVWSVASMAWILIPSVFMLAVTFLFMTFNGLYQMWFPANTKA